MKLRDAFVRKLARNLLRLFFRRIELVGAENVPVAGPVIFVGNHGNGLMDPFAAVAFLPRVPRFLAKSTLWMNPAVRPLLALAGSIPVYRKQDGGDMSQNDSTFESCFDVLGEGGAIALFPEGISHDEPALQPLKTGAARIALGAAQRGFAPRIVPIGLTFEDKVLFRSRLLLQIGEPMELDEHLAAAGDAQADERELARQLTEAIGESLASVTLNFESWDDAKLVAAAVEVFARSSDADAMPGRANLAEHFSFQQRFGAAYEQLREAEPERVESLRGQIERYVEALDRAGVRDDQLMAKYPRERVVAYLRRRVPWLPVWLPVAAIGAVLNYLPFRACGAIASTVQGTPDQPATFKLLGGVFLFPLTWAIEAHLASGWGLAAGFYMLALAPITGWAALLFHERTESLEQEVRAYVALRRDPELAAALRDMREEIETEIAQLGELAEKERG